MSFPTGWTKKVAIVIDHTLVGSGGVSNFSVLLVRSNFGSNGNAMFFGAAAAQADGGDIRFSSDSAGTTQLACDVIAFGLDGSSGAADSVCQIRANVPSISSAGDTTIYVWYNAGGGLTQPSASNTYGQYNAYDASWLSFYPDGATDRTSNAKTLTGSGGVTFGGATGKVGAATTFDGSDDYGTNTAQPATPTAYTLIAWAKPASTSAGAHNILSLGNSTMYATQLRRDDSDWNLYQQSAGDKNATEAAAVSAGTYAHLVGTWDSSNIKLYRNAVLKQTSTASVGSNTASTIHIGADRFGANQQWDGDLDEVQYHSVARAAAWITTEYNQTNTPAGFAAGGTITTISSGNRRRRALVVAG